MCSFLRQTSRLTRILCLVGLTLYPLAAEKTSAQILVYGYGATLGGPNWDGFPSRMTPNLNTPAGGGYPEVEQLNGNYSVYLVTETDGLNFTTCPHTIAPTLLSAATWWNAVLPQWTEVTVDYGAQFDQFYNACPQGEGIAVTLNGDGTLTLVDLYAGGLRDRVMITLSFCIDVQTEPYVHCHNKQLVRIVLDRPGYYEDKVVECSGYPFQYTRVPINALPGAVYTRVDQGVAGNPVDILVPILIVEWVSTDVAGLSPRNVDAADLGALSTELGLPVRWGFPGETLPYPGAPLQNYRVNFVPYGDLGNPSSTANRIDGSDLAAFSTDLSTGCSISKVDTDAERTAILTWFGFAATGRTIYVESMGDVPEYELADPAQNLRAIADPYGYRNLVAGSPALRIPWSAAKRLYR